MAMIDNSNVIDFSSRPRRVHQNSNKNYDGEGERNLELRGIFEVLSAYKGYEGGINCSKCGKLYKSKVCFIKHLWEHSVYWDLFPGDKNHERVLAIQAALILYSHYLGVTQEDADRSVPNTRQKEASVVSQSYCDTLLSCRSTFLAHQSTKCSRLRELLVTSPSAHEAPAGTSHTTPKKNLPKPTSYNSAPLPGLAVENAPCYPTTPLRGLTLETPNTLRPSTPMKGGPRRAILHDTDPYPMTPPKDFEPFMVCPATPRKDMRRSAQMKMQRTARRKRRLLLE